MWSVRISRVVVGMMSLVAAGPALATAPTWSIQSTPNPRSNDSSGLTAVSCANVTACVALGDGLNAGSPISAGGPDTVGERWQGVSWAVQPTPDPDAEGYYISGVECPAADACYAVGSLEFAQSGPQPLLFSFNGIRWRSLAVPGIGSTDALSGISCTSKRFCLAVGGGGRPLVERWDGTRWRVVRVGNAPTLGYDAVSCTAVDACTAVGAPKAGRQLGLVEHWSGSKWTIRPTPRMPHAKGGELLDISCPTARACIAVGDYRNGSGRQLALAEKWNGKSWKLLSTDTRSGGHKSSGLLSVSCATATACAAVGNSAQHPLVEWWDGKRWTLQATPTPAGSGEALNSVSCVSAVHCTAVGCYTDSRSGVTVTLALSYS